MEQVLMTLMNGLIKQVFQDMVKHICMMVVRVNALTNLQQWV